ncbi:MAG: ribosomal protein L11 methyltransferase [Deltaproteobacteria bacterium RBG_16_48_10]|nr:MAG: ribosomal protein L11 methyltransferase [Deltaproteobacteria bacterium RBG_16_48_10]
MKQWMALRLLIPPEFQEAVPNFLMEQGATGLEEKGTEGSKKIELKAYFLKDGREKRVIPALHRYLKSLHRIFLKKFSYGIETTLIPEKDWGEDWKRFFKPVPIGSRFVVFPPWKRVRLRKGQIPIEITPGMAFGTGTHGTTQLCVQALETRLKKKGGSVLDVGTGSGILAIVAAKLGAQEVCGIDMDQVAVEVARENVEKNGVEGVVSVRKGGIGRIQKKFDLVVANIDFKGLKKLKGALLGHLHQRGFLILSGILREEEGRIRQSYLEAGAFRLIQVAHQGEWSCLTFKKEEGAGG